MALSPRDRRAMIILGIIAAVAIGFFFLTRGGGPTEEEAVPPGAPSPPPAVSPTPSPEPRPPRFTFFSGRDPFLPLVVAPEAVGEAPTGETPAPGESPGEPVTEPSPGAEGEAVTETGTTIGGHTVRVIDIFQQGGEQVVQVEIDGETFVVSEGEEFSDNFRLESIQGACADFLFGDEPFTLCEGGERK
jgi:hypothetical protein